MTPPNISIREAAEMAGVDKKTVDRRLRKYLKDNGLTLEQATDILRIEQSGNRKQFFLSEHFVREAIMQQDAGSTQKRGEGSIDAELVHQLNAKDDQLKTKDDQISKLQELLRESTLALRQEQALHLRTQEQKRPLLSIGSAEQAIKSAGETADRSLSDSPIRWRRIAGTSAIVFCVMGFGFALWHLLVVNSYIPSG